MDGWVAASLLTFTHSPCLSLALYTILFLWFQLFRATRTVGNRINSPVLMANAWHHRSDAMSSVVALVGIGAACLGFPLLDPIAGLCVAGMVSQSVSQSAKAKQKFTSGIVFDCLNE